MSAFGCVCKKLSVKFVELRARREFNSEMSRATVSAGVVDYVCVCVCVFVGPGSERWQSKRNDRQALAGQ